MYWRVWESLFNYERDLGEIENSIQKREKFSEITSKSVVYFSMSFKLKISTKTWVKDNYGLFDYDLDKDMVLKEMVVKTEGTLARSLDEVLYISKARKSEPIHGI